MKKLLLLSLLCVFLCGCLTTPNEEFVSGVKIIYKQIGPSWENYIKNDPNLSKDDKEIRLQSSTQMWKLIYKAEEQIKKGK